MWYLNPFNKILFNLFPFFYYCKTSYVMTSRIEIEDSKVDCNRTLKTPLSGTHRDLVHLMIQILVVVIFVGEVSFPWFLSPSKDLKWWTSRLQLSFIKNKDPRGVKAGWSPKKSDSTLAFFICFVSSWACSCVSIEPGQEGFLFHWGVHPVPDFLVPFFKVFFPSLCLLATCHFSHHFLF